jgi:hypothetical protein
MILMCSGDTIGHQSRLRLLSLSSNCLPQVHTQSHLSSQTGQVWHRGAIPFTLHLTYEPCGMAGIRGYTK